MADPLEKSQELEMQDSHNPDQKDQMSHFMGLYKAADKKN